MFDCKVRRRLHIHRASVVAGESLNRVSSSLRPTLVVMARRQLKPMRPEAWAKWVPAPTPANRKLEQIFLSEHWQYGGVVHHSTARALVAALSGASEIAVGHALYLRLYTEYGIALETLGAWGWTFQNYRSHKLFLDALLSYPHSAPREFFRAVLLNRSGSLQRLLRLSRSRRVTAAIATGFEWTEPEAEAAMDECMRNLRLAARQYLSENEIIRTTYNKAKHGVTIVRPPDLAPREFYVLAPHLVLRGKRDRARYDLSKFSIDKTMIRALEHGVVSTGRLIQFLAGVARALHCADLLYSDRSQAAAGR